MFIYLITNLKNNKRYIGKTERNDINIRFKEHIYRSRCSNSFSKQIITNAIHKYGEENFKIEELHKAFSIEELNKKEIEFINKFNTLSPNGYNISLGGDGVGHTEEIKRKISIKNTGKKRSVEAKIKMRMAKLGKKQAQQHIDNAAKSRTKNLIIGTNLSDGSKLFFEHANLARNAGFHTSHIAACISGKRHSHRGYKWERCQDL